MTIGDTSCNKVGSCQNKNCFIYQMVIEGKSCWLGSDKPLNEDTIWPKLRVSCHPSICGANAIVICDSYISPKEYSI